MANLPLTDAERIQRLERQVVVLKDNEKRISWALIALMLWQCLFNLVFYLK